MNNNNELELFNVGFERIVSQQSVVDELLLALYKHTRVNLSLAPEVVIKNTTFSNVCFSNALLMNVRFENCKFESVIFRDTCIKHCEFIDSRFYGPRFISNIIHNTEFKRCDIVNGLFHNDTVYNSRMFRCSFSNATMRYCIFERSVFENDEFITTKLYECDFTAAHASFRDSCFTNSDKPSIKQNCPSEGSFIGYKKLDGEYIATLVIPEDAKRVNSTSSKCRCSKAYVKEIVDSVDHARVTSGRSMHDPNFIYKVGQTVSVDDFCDDPLIECAPGIHFFLRKEEAENY